jgi:hypothetical protein
VSLSDVAVRRTREVVLGSNSRHGISTFPMLVMSHIDVRQSSPLWRRCGKQRLTYFDIEHKVLAFTSNPQPMQQHNRMVVDGKYERRNQFVVTRSSRGYCEHSSKSRIAASNRVSLVVMIQV